MRARREIGGQTRVRGTLNQRTTRHQQVESLLTRTGECAGPCTND